MNKSYRAQVSSGIFEAIQIFFAFAVGITLIGLLAYALHATPVMTPADCPGSGTSSEGALVINNTACPPRDERGCQSGALFATSDNVQLCDYVDHAVGTPCTSTCHTENTSTACTTDLACASSDPTTCLGYCEVPEGDESWTGSPYADVCEGKLTFLPYFVAGGEESSCESMNWLYYSNYSAECNQIEGCRWYATVMQLRGNGVSYVTSQPGTYDGCLDMLNMTNVGCIRAYRLNFTETFATALFQSIWGQDPDAGNPDFRYAGYGCIYNYACGFRNESFMTDPDNLLAKRALATEITAEARFADLVSANAPAMKERWAGIVERMKRVTCNL
jgi:hypothetical protein